MKNKSQNCSFLERRINKSENVHHSSTFISIGNRYIHINFKLSGLDSKIIYFILVHLDCKINKNKIKNF